MTTPTTAGNETINYSGTLTTTTAANGALPPLKAARHRYPGAGYFGQRFLTNNLTGSWDAIAARHVFAHLSLSHAYDRGERLRRATATVTSIPAAIPATFR